MCGLSSTVDGAGLHRLTPEDALVLFSLQLSDFAADLEAKIEAQASKGETDEPAFKVGAGVAELRNEMGVLRMFKPGKRQKVVHL